MANGGITAFGANQMLGEFFGRRIDYPITLFVALARSTAPGPFTEGGELDEPEVELGYLRAEVPNDSTYWTLAENVITNALDISFAPCTSSWGTIRYYAIADSAVGGNLYFYGDLGESTPTDPLDEIVVPAGTLDIVVGPIYTGSDGIVG